MFNESGYITIIFVIMNLITYNLPSVRKERKNEAEIKERENMENSQQLSSWGAHPEARVEHEAQPENLPDCGAQPLATLPSA